MLDARATRGELRLALSLRLLPAPVGRFWWRARRHARRSDDRFSLSSAARPAELAELLAQAHDRSVVVELGTGTAWSTIALALDDQRRSIVSYDPTVRPEREAYLELAGRAARERIELRAEPDVAGPRPGDAHVELLFIDSSHDRQSVIAAFRAWRGALAPGAVVAFHDHGHPHYPGVREAVAELGLSGHVSGGVFLWSVPRAA